MKNLIVTTKSWLFGEAKRFSNQPQLLFRILPGHFRGRKSVFQGRNGFSVFVAGGILRHFSIYETFNMEAEGYKDRFRVS